MYFDYMVNWIYRAMQLPVPIVTAPNVYGLVTIFDIFMFTVYIGVFIILIRYLITDELSLRVGSPEDISYSSDMYMNKKIQERISSRIANKRKVNDYINKKRIETKKIDKRDIPDKRYLDTRLIKRKSIAGKLVTRKFKRKAVWFDVNNN